MPTTYLPQTGAAELAVGQSAAETSANEALRHLDAGHTRSIIEDRDLTAPPGSCADGARYLVAATATGAWAGEDGRLAIAVGTDAANGWLFETVAAKGFRLSVRDESLELEHNGTTWVTVAGASGLTECSDSQGWTGSSTSTGISPRRMFTLAAEVSLTDGATVTPDFNTGLNFKWTIGGNRTLANPTNAKSGQSGIINITQDGTGSRVISYGGNWKFPGGAATNGVLSTAAGAVDSIAYYVRADGTILATLSKAFS
jgi:hypothetical protein